MTLPTTEGYNYVNKLTGEVYNGTDDIDDEHVDEWVLCKEDNIAKWQDCLTQFKSENTELLSDLDTLQDEIFVLRDHNNYASISDDITADDVLYVLPFKIKSVPDDNSDEDDNSDDNDSDTGSDNDLPYTFDDLMTDAKADGATNTDGYTEYMELYIVVITLTYNDVTYNDVKAYIKALQSCYNDNHGDGTGNTPDETKTWNDDVYNGDNEDVFKVGVIET